MASGVDQLVGLLLGAAFGARALDGNRSLWSRVAYGAVGVDLVRAAMSQEQALLSGQVSKASSIRTADGKLTVPLTFQAKTAKTITERVSYIHEQMVKGTRDPKVYSLARAVLSRKCGGEWCIPERDSLNEVRALFAEVRSRVRYTLDPVDFDAFQTPGRTLDLKTGDCVPATSLVVTTGYKFKPIGEVKEGDLVMGDGQWTRVTKFWEKGEKKLLSFELRNGCTLRCTPDHKLFVVPRKRSNGKWVAGDRTEAIEVRARNVQIGDDLLTPSRLPMGREHLDPDRAWLLGTYVADGWGEEYRAAIALVV